LKLSDSQESYGKPKENEECGHDRQENQDAPSGANAVWSAEERVGWERGRSAGRRRENDFWVGRFRSLREDERRGSTRDHEAVS
jgi:hypothetical protein